MTLQAIVNWGRWLAQCPECGNWLEVSHLSPTLRCVVCCPDLRANCFEQIPGEPGRFREVPDTSRRAAAFEAATAYPVEFPTEREAIMAALRPRNVQNMNWNPGETVADLLNENAEHGIGV